MTVKRIRDWCERHDVTWQVVVFLGIAVVAGILLLTVGR